MAQLRSVSIVGDSNVRRHMSSTNTRRSPLMSGAQVILCGRISVFQTSLNSIRPESDAVIVACITNFLTSSEAGSSVSLRVEGPLDRFLTKLTTHVASKPEVRFFLCPPMYRSSPLWYRDGLSEIMVKFNSSIQSIPNRPANLFLMPSFAKIKLEADGIHLNPYSGLEYIHHLFDAAEELLTSAELPVEARVEAMTQSSRALVDRVVVLEQDHSRLVNCFDYQSASSAELFDFEENVRNESFIMVQGLRILPKLDPKEWQQRACQDVEGVLTAMGFDHRVKFILNSTGRGKDSKTLYKAQLGSKEVSRAIRDKFSSYFAGGKDARPAALASISIRNCVTPGTLARIAVLQLLAKRYKESNPGSRTQVVAYESRPLLKLTPPPDASDRRQMTFSYMEAIMKLPTSFTAEEIDALMRRVSPRLHSNLRSTLYILTEDMLKKKSTSRKKTTPATATSGSESSEFRTPEGGRKRGRASPAAGPAPKK